MKKNKYIKEIADQLPPVYEQTVSGFYMDYNQDGDQVPYPNIVTHEINHERRLRKAYEKLGMDGIHSYLDWIKKLQEDRRDQRSSN